MDELPGVANPDAGFVATANEMNLPEDFPADRHITYDWYAPYRKHRIDGLLERTTDATVESMARMQSDYVSIPAKRILAGVAALGLDDVDAVPELAGLLEWDGELAADSRQALVFEIWYRRHLRPAVLAWAVAQVTGADPAGKDTAHVLGRIANAEDLLADARIDIALLENPGDRLGPDPAGFLADTVRSTLTSAVEDVRGLVGNDESAWQWGTLHGAVANHPLKQRLTGVDPSLLSRGPHPRGGSGDTVGNTAYGPNFLQSAGSTFRIAIDVGEWDSSLAMNAPGQSGNLDDPHYADLFELWATEQSFPLLYSRDRVEAATERRIRLVPPRD
jgi:penicillin amidase